MKSFIPQATPLYAADFRGEVHLVVGWGEPNSFTDGSESVTWWHPILAKLAPPDAAHPSDVAGDSASTYVSPAPGQAPDPDDYSMAFAATLEEARALAIRWGSLSR